MNDTSPEMEAMFDKMMREKSNEERFMMGFGMFELARAIVISSLPKDLSPAELRVQLFKRFYENDFTELEQEKIIKHIREKNKNR